MCVTSSTDRPKQTTPRMPITRKPQGKGCCAEVGGSCFWDVAAGTCSAAHCPGAYLDWLTCQPQNQVDTALTSCPAGMVPTDERCQCEQCHQRISPLRKSCSGLVQVTCTCPTFAPPALLSCRPLCVPHRVLHSWVACRQLKSSYAGAYQVGLRCLFDHNPTIQSISGHVPWTARLWPCRSDSKDTSHMPMLSTMLDMTGIVQCKC
jgi:hypothetical protein